MSAGIEAQPTSNVVASPSTDCTGDEFHLQSCSSFQFQQRNMCTSGQTVVLTCVGKYSLLFRVGSSVSLEFCFATLLNYVGVVLTPHLWFSWPQCNL